MKVLLVSTLLIHYVSSIFIYEFYLSSLYPPSEKWISKNKDKFEKLGAFANYSRSVGHILHMITTEDIKFFFGVNLPKENGIPTTNPDLSASDSEGVLSSIPSYPVNTPSAGYHSFVRYMDNVFEPKWGQLGSTVLNKLAHAYHMQDSWARTRDTADSFNDIPGEVCDAAMDFTENGVNKVLQAAFEFVKYNFTEAYLQEKMDLPPLTDEKSWDLWKNKLVDIRGMSSNKATGLFFHCIMKRFSPCCNRKTLGGFDYTKIGSGKCISDCIYERNGKPGSKYYFAPGDDIPNCN